MAATVQILGWKSVGLRCPDHEIACADEKDVPRAITLIQMPNGTGKTTTLNLLRLALSGQWYSAAPNPLEVRKLQKKGSRGGEGLFEVALKLNGRRVTIQMSFDFDAGRVRYRTTRNQGMVDGFDPPVEFRRFLNANFINFFVFDGELANNLLDEESTDAEKVVEALFQLNALDRMGAKVRDYWDRRAEADAGDERTQRTRENRVQRARKRLSFLEAKQKELLRRKREASERLEAQRKAYQQELQKIAEAGDKVGEAEKKVGEAHDQVREQSNDVLDLMRDPHALSATFAQDIYELKINLDRAKLPGTAAREFFHDLACEKECVCGTKITPAISEAIRKRAKTYLGSDEVGFLNAMKTDIEEAVGASRQAPSRTLEAAVKELEKRVRAERDARNAFDEFTDEAKNADPAVAKAKEEIDRLEAELAGIEAQLEKFEDKDGSPKIDETWGIEVMRKRVDGYEKKLAATKATLQLRKKRDILIKILGEAHQLARAGVTGEICNDANARIKDLLPNNDIRIERIERCLVLEGQEGGSVGENLSVAYGFLATLFDRADHQLPFVVDSPAGPIDLEVRPKIGALVPQLSKQFIAFTISSERAQFVARLKAGCREPVQFLTIFRKGPAAIEAQARGTGQAKETKDGWIVAGEEFFNGFQLEKEEEPA